MIKKLDPFKTEKELITQCIKRNRKAQQRLFEMHSGIMLSICRRYVHDAGTAEELMLQGFMIVFEKVGSFKFEGSFQGWMRKIMVNTCLTWIRKNKLMYKEVDLMEVDAKPNLEYLENHLEAEDLMNLIAELPQGYRTIFNLYAIEGYKHEEIGKQLGISKNTSKSQLSRARKYLQQRLVELDSVSNTKNQDNGS